MGQTCKKSECANHACKCLRSNLEKLVQDNPSFKGKGKLCKRTRIRIVTAVRCAIRMRSGETDKGKAKIKLEHDIRNTLNHIYGEHSRCSEFCKAKNISDLPQMSQMDNNDDLENSEHNVFEEQASLWSDGTSIDAQEESRLASELDITDLESGMRQSIALLLNNIAKKAESLLGNQTSNLAENWMHIRAKYDGGKMYNHCNRGSWNTKCYLASLRFNRGVDWSPKTWEEITSSSPGDNFIKLYQQRKQCHKTNKHSKQKEEIKKGRFKRKLSSLKESSSKKAKKDYGPSALQVEKDITEEQLKQAQEYYLQKNINISDNKIKQLEKSTRNQSLSSEWRSERKKRLTASIFGAVCKRRPTILVKKLVEQLIYSNFSGTSATQRGLNEERITIKEYISMKEKLNIKITVERVGLVIDKVDKYLAGSPDGKVVETKPNEPPCTGLLEIKNVLDKKEYTLAQATSKVQNFCLEKVTLESGISDLQLKRNHNYYYQCQGLLHICNLPWIDFVVRAVNPYDLHVERIWKDDSFWKNSMQPKLKAFYHKALLPELASPRHDKYPGIREPGNWFGTENPSTISAKTKRTERTGKQRQRKLCTNEHDNGTETTTNDIPSVPRVPSTKRGKAKTQRTLPDTDVPSTSGTNTGIRSRRKATKIQFIGRRISHEWIEDDNSHKWYTGMVTDVKKKKNGQKEAEYEVLYDGDEYPTLVDHLMEDFESGSVKFIDI